MKKTTITTKLTLGLLSLFIVIICFGGLGIFYVNRLSSDAGMILKDNHISVEYCNHMFKALDEIPSDRSQLEVFEKNLKLEENNITEPGEYEATAEVRSLFEAMKKDPAGLKDFRNIRKAIFRIEDVNQLAIIHKNVIASNTAAQATLWLTVIVSILSLAAFTFVLRFPSIISKPIRILADGITEISKKNYSKRIILDQQDEFRALADTFNDMARRLDEYEHSNLAKLESEKSRIEAIVNKMNDGIIGLNDQQEILFVNATARQLFGLDGENVIGMYAPDLAMHNDLFRKVLQNNEKKQLSIFINNSENFFARESILIQTDEVIGGEVIILRNVTPFKELDEAKTNFIATISHELKIPLFAINMGTQLLNDERVGTLNKDQAEILATIGNNAERLVKITEELLNLTQIETGQIQLKKTQTKPEVILLRAIQAVQAQLSQLKIKLVEKVSPDLPLISVDEDKTTWAMINLLTNAIKYSAEDGIIEAEIKYNGNHIAFSVSDYGRGIEEKYQALVFDKYFQVPGTSKQSGTGLGLSISKEFIEAQGGEIWMKSSYGKGSTFGFNISKEMI